MAYFLYDEAAYQLRTGSISWTSDTIKVRLVPSSVTPARTDTAMTGYTDAGGSDKTLSGCTITKDTSNHRITYDASDPAAWASVPAATIAFVLVFKFVTNDADSVPIACLDPSNVTSNGTDVTAPFSSLGVWYDSL